MNHDELSRFRWLWYALGVAMIGYGAWGLKTHVSTTQLIHAGRLLVVDVGGHDGAFAPIAFVLAFLTQRLLPPMVRTPVRVGLALSALLVLLALPDIYSNNRLRNPSVLPLDYERNVVGLLVAVAVGVALSIAVNAVRSRSQRGSRKLVYAVSEAHQRAVPEEVPGLARGSRDVPDVTEPELPGDDGLGSPSSG